MARLTPRQTASNEEEKVRSSPFNLAASARLPELPDTFIDGINISAALRVCVHNLAIPQGMMGLGATAQSHSITQAGRVADAHRRLTQAILWAFTLADQPPNRCCRCLVDAPPFKA